MSQDEAVKCMSVAEEAMKNQDWDKALRFLDKSMRFKETQKAIYLKSEVMKKMKGEGPDANNNEQSADPADDTQSNGTASTSKTSQKKQPTPKKEERKKEETQPQEPPNYSKEDVEKCKEILSKSNYYEILGITKTAEENEIKKAYKKLALRFHPDKNRAPQATDAFKKVSSAFACINDPEKRKLYDEHGSEENFQQRYRQQYQEEFDPEDLFQMFFGGHVYTGGFGPRGHTVYRRQQRRGDQGEQQQRNPQPAGVQFFQQFAPMLLLLILTLLSNIESFTTGHLHNYSYRQTMEFKIQIQSYRLNEPYWISEATYNIIKDDRDQKLKVCLFFLIIYSSLINDLKVN
ncbi:UNKNOWN [Stylonychia lemnae]|uniref:J domain-containing protein n=1 Tax=Stylonychia lemnae TaxID=5949 RepID=A0A078AKD1_STYLE|nr:UNKNOWN [Stylonychia lemnae]|eukprot:CDW82351.1 UNKNOWN [Stylonychia lemnae]